jgi:hypothetical protein
MPRTIRSRCLLHRRRGGGRKRNGDGEPQIQPDSISARILGQDENVNKQPTADRHPQRYPDEIAWGLPKGPDVFELRTCDARGDDNREGDENRSNR